MCDGTTPGSPVLADGHTLYTPGLSENRGGTSIFYDFDRIGNLWTADGTTKNQLGYIDFYSFGGAFAAAGTTTPFGFGGANGCQTEADTGLMLMRYRYYDSRIGRFISQDPIGDGNNWYAYADNNPVNETDPRGLQAQDGPPGTLPGYDPNDPSTNIFNPDTAPQIVVKVLASTWSVPSAWNGFGMGGGMGPGLGGGGGFAKNESYQRPGESDTHYRFRGLWWAIKQFATLQPTPEESEAWAKTSGVVRDAAKGKGNFGLGSATRAEADVAGKAWVGDGYRVSGNGKAWVSQDGLRQYRPSSYKPNLGREQANLEQRNVNSGQWQSNGHIDVVP